MQCLLILNFVGIINQRIFEIRCRPCQSNTLYYSIKWIFKPIALFLLRSKHDVVFDFVIETWTFRVSQYNMNILNFGFQIFGDASDSTTSSSWTYKCINISIKFIIDLWASKVVMNSWIIEILKLIHKESPLLFSIVSCLIEKVIAINYWYLRNLDYVSS